MTVLRKLVVALGFDSAEYDAGLEAAARRAENFSNQVGGKLSSIAGSMQKTGAIMSAGITAPLTLAAGKAISDASDLEESLNKVGVVFEDSAGIIKDFAATAVTDLGMTEQSALEAAGTYGNLFYAMGIGMETNAEMSTSLVTLAADLASFNNMDPTEVLGKLRAGLTGETEPLKRLGVNINAAAIEAKAMEMGLVALGEEITPAAKAQASYALILEQTTKAQGDFERTSDGTANMMRIMKASVTQVSASFGKLLLPIITPLIQKLVKFLDKLNNMSPAGKKVVLIIAAIAAAIGPLLLILGTLLSAVGAITTFMMGPAVAAIGGVIAAMAPILLIVAAVIAVILLLKLAWDSNFLGIRDTLTNFWESGVKPIFETLKKWLGVAIPAVIQFLSDAWNNVLLPAISAVWNFISTKLFPLFVSIAEFVGAVFGLVIRVFAGVWQNVLLPALTAVWTFLSTLLKPAFDFIANVITTSVVPALEKATQWFGDHVAPAISSVGDAIDDVIGWIDNLTSKLRNIKLPDWMTPGSPTPWENGLVGVSDALHKLSSIELPRLSTRLDLQPQFAGINSFDGKYNVESPALSATTSRNVAVSGQSEMFAELKQLMAQPLDEKRLARSIRDAILAVK